MTTKIKALLIALSMLLVIGASASAQQVATDYIGIVTGIVTDQSGPVSGADVTITCQDGPSTTRVTDSTGAYYATFACEPDKVVTVTAVVAGGASGSNTGTLVQIGTVPLVGTTVDVSLAKVDVSIPEFPVALLPAMLTVFGVGLVKRRF